MLLIPSNISIINIDASIVLNNPKISKYKSKIISKLAPVLKISESQISIKGITSNGLSFLNMKNGWGAEVIISLKKMEIKSTSKINIGLHVHNRRSDGFHNISTLFQEINLCDTVEIIEDKIFSCITDCGTIIEKNNFGTKAFNVIKAKYPKIPNVRISIKKIIPTKAGLGGGSSNGTAVIVGLNDLFKLKLSNKELSEMASKVSSDSAFFVNGGMQFGTSRGERLDIIKNIQIPKHILLVHPGIKISTKEAFNHLKNHLLNEDMDINLSQLLRELNNYTFDSKLFKNDFEMYVFKTHPEIGAIKLKILDFGAKYASLSGTGSTVFGIFSSKKICLKHNLSSVPSTQLTM